MISLSAFARATRTFAVAIAATLAFAACQEEPAPPSGRAGAGAAAPPTSPSPSASSGAWSHASPSDVGPTSDAAAPSADGAAPKVDAGTAAGLPRPSQGVVSAALAAPLSSYHRNASTGDIWCLPCDGAPVVLAAAAYAGDTSVDARLLQQMREVLIPGNEPFATGAYAANDERNVTAMFAIAKKVPRVFAKLTPAEVHAVDLVMEATLVADVYATADKTNAGGPPRTFDGSDNSNRDWNPNYREGMIGAVLVGTEYFGGKAATEALLAAYDHAAFTSALAAAGFPNLSWTFSTYQSNTNAPSPQAVQSGIQGYTMHGMGLGALLDMYVYLANDTFGATVSCGLAGGAGISVGGTIAGRVVTGCAGLPNLGMVGMEKEFDSVDAEGARSDAGYVRLGLRTDLFNQLVLLVYGDWKDTAASRAALTRVAVGVQDFFYKAHAGYESYSHASDQGLFSCKDMDCTINEALWTEVLAPAHGL